MTSLQPALAPRVRILCCLLVLAFAVVLLTARPALADDVTAPQVVSVILTPSHIDTESLAQPVTLTATVTSAVAGFGGTVAAPFHEDYVFYQPTVTLVMEDGARQIILDNGKLLL